MLNVKRTVAVNQTSWAELKEAAEAGKLGEMLHSGDTLGITLKNGEDVVLVVGQDQNGNVFFVTQDCLREEHRMNRDATNRMNRDATNRGGWAATEMRRYLNEDVLALLPDDLQAVIKPTTIVQIVDGKRVETQDKLFCLSATQVFGNGSWTAKEPEDTQLDIFRREKDRVKECGSYGTWFWWLRSAYSYYTNTFCGVSCSGYGSSYGANNSYGVALGFSL